MMTVTTGRRLALLLALASLVTLASLMTLALSRRPAQAQAFGGSQPGSDIRVEWEAGTTRRGQPAVTGYVHNERGLIATNVRLLIESLDGAGQVVGRQVGFVDGGVPVKGRSYFEVRVNTPGASYRVTVGSVDWGGGGGGAGS